MRQRSLTQDNQYITRHNQVMDSLTVLFLIFLIISAFIAILYINIITCVRYRCVVRKSENCHHVSTIGEPGNSQEDVWISVFQASTIGERRNSQDDVWSISIPETSELPSYEEMQAIPEKPPSYWSLYNQPVIK